jgi:hypothetical protein
MRKYLALAAVAFALVAPAAARANGYIQYGQRIVDPYGFRKSHAPRAAPWFVYWPYEAYFTYPAPTGAPFPPSHLASPPGFHPHMYEQGGAGQGLAPYPTNGFGQ